MSTEQVSAFANHLERIHFDGTGCGTVGTNACSHCFGPSPMGAWEIAAEAARFFGIIDAEHVPGCNNLCDATGHCLEVTE